METLIQCKNAAFGYEGRIVVDELNFSIEKGDYFCIVGENGSGKSTLVKGLFRLIPPLQGELITAAALKKRRAGYLSQEEPQEKKDFPASVWEIVMTGFSGSMGLRPFYRKYEKEAALFNLQRLGIENLKDACFRELSGGQKRRVLLSRSLCACEDILILDEPTAGLDPLVRADVYALLKSLNSDLKITIVMVSHAVETIFDYANRVLHLKNRQAFFGSAAEYVQSDIGRAFLQSSEKTNQ